MDASHTTVAASTKTSVEKRKTYAEAYAEFDASVERQVAPSSLSSPIVKRPSPLPSPTISRLNQIPFAAISDTKPQMPAFPKHSIFYEPQEKEAEDLPEIESNVAPISKNSIFYEDHSCYPQPADDVAAASDSIRKSGPVPHVHTNFKIHPSIVSAGRDSALGSASAASAGTVPSMALDSFPSDSFPSSARAGRETTETLPSGASTGSRNAIFDVDFSPKQHAQAIRDDPTSSPMFPSSTQSSEEDVSVNGISINCLLRRMSPHILQDGSQLLNISKLKKVVLDFFKFNEAQVDSCNSDASKALASSQLIPLSFFPTRKNWIGEGRFAAVYRASFAIPVTSTAPSSPSMKYGPNEADKENCPNRNTFTREATEYCAVKVPHDYDREAQLNATTEATILYFISQQTSPSRSHHIVRLVGIKMKTEDKIILRRSNDIALPLQDLRLSSPSSDTEFVPSNESSINDSLILREELFHGRIYAPTTILEYCSGGCVFDRIRSSPSLFGKRMWLKICQKLAEAVLFLHTGLDDDLTVLHLDIKPQNILLDGDMEPKLSDFGSALIVRRRQPMTLQDGLGRGTQGLFTQFSLC